MRIGGIGLIRPSSPRSEWQNANELSAQRPTAPNRRIEANGVAERRKDCCVDIPDPAAGGARGVDCAALRTADPRPGACRMGSAPASWRRGRLAASRTANRCQSLEPVRVASVLPCCLPAASVACARNGAWHLDARLGLRRRTCAAQRSSDRHDQYSAQRPRVHPEFSRGARPLDIVAVRDEGELSRPETGTFFHGPFDADPTRRTRLEQDVPHFRLFAESCR